MTSTQHFARYPSLEDVPVLITGGAAGIGASMVEHFALQGAKVAFVDIAAESARELIRELTGRCPHEPRFWPCDLKDVVKLKMKWARFGYSSTMQRMMIATNWMR
jgi:NAD(P)-dependent dehydrogenase (short-subunit alcohol dehydrogenase family)